MLSESTESGSQQRCAITGAAGYVGSRVSDYFAARGWSVVEFSRSRRLVDDRRSHVAYRLESPVAPEVFSQHRIGTLIHCAYDFGLTTWADIHRVNVEGSIQLLRAAKEGGVHTIIVLSSISAFAGCRSLYGTAKLAVERAAAEMGAFVLRPGLVYGSGQTGGVFGSLRRLATSSTLVPLIGSGRYPQYLIHEEDLCALMLAISQGSIPVPGGPMVVAGQRPWQIRELLRALRPDSTLRFIPIPWQAIWLGLKATELCRIPAPFRSDSVLSLVSQNSSPDFSVASRLGCRFREFPDGLGTGSSFELSPQSIAKEPNEE